MSKKKIVFVGKINVDVVATAPEVTELEDTKYVATGGTSVALGGAPANATRALFILGRAFEDHFTTRIVTCIGQRPARERYSDVGEFLAAKHSHDMMFELLSLEGMNITDLTAGANGPGVPMNVVANYRGGRTILKQQVRLRDDFQASMQGLISGARHNLESEVMGADFVFVDPTRSAVGVLAVEACQKAGVPVVVDYGMKSWPDDPEQASRINKILQAADILIVPADAVVDGMENGVKDPDKLFEILSGKEYSAQTIMMSDGGKPVKLYHAGKMTEIGVLPISGRLYANGVGDMRDAALMFFLARGDEMEAAARKATELASLKIQFLGPEWGDHIHDHVAQSPLFYKDIKPLIKGASAESVHVEDEPIV